MSEYILYLGAAFLLGASILTTQIIFDKSATDPLRAQAEFAQQHEQHTSGGSFGQAQD